MCNSLILKPHRIVLFTMLLGIILQSPVPAFAQPPVTTSIEAKDPPVSVIAIEPVTVTRIETGTVPPTPCQCGTLCPKQALNDTDAISGSLVLVGSLSVGGFAFLRRKRKQDASAVDKHVDG